MKRTFEKIAAQLLRYKRSGFAYFGHGIAEQYTDSYIERLHLLSDQFVAIIEFWKRMGVDFISMKDVHELSKKQFRTDKPWVHFTFDDGYRNNLTTLLPIMEHYQIPFTVFASTGLIEQSKRLPSFIIRAALIHYKADANILSYKLTTGDSRDKRINIAEALINHYKYLPQAQGELLLHEIVRLLTAEEWAHCNQLYKNDQLLSLDELKLLGKHKLVTIGAHGYNHAILHSEQNEACIQQELTAPLQYVNKDVISHAYPNGTSKDYSATTMRKAQECDINLSFTTEEAFITKRTNPLIIPRYFLSGSGSSIARKWIFVKSS